MTYGTDRTTSVAFFFLERDYRWGGLYIAHASLETNSHTRSTIGAWIYTHQQRSCWILLLLLG